MKRCDLSHAQYSTSKPMKIVNASTSVKSAALRMLNALLANNNSANASTTASPNAAKINAAVNAEIQLQ